MPLVEVAVKRCRQSKIKEQRRTIWGTAPLVPLLPLAKIFTLEENLTSLAKLCVSPSLLGGVVAT